MKGEAIIAECIGVVGLIVYGLLLQHMWAVMLHEPETSWINQARAWWVTRGSRKVEARLHRVWNQPPVEEG